MRRIEDVGQMRAGRLSEQELPAMIPELQDYRLDKVVADFGRWQIVR